MKFKSTEEREVWLIAVIVFQASMLFVRKGLNPVMLADELLVELRKRTPKNTE